MNALTAKSKGRTERSPAADLEASQVRRDSERFAAIVAIQHDLASEQRSLREMIALLVERIRNLTLATGSMLGLMESGRLVCRATSGDLTADCTGLGAAVYELASFCAETGLLLHVDDARKDPRPSVLRCDRCGIASVVAIPLQYRGEVVGVLAVVAPEPQAFDDRDVHAMKLMADLAAAAIGYAAESELAQAQLSAERVAAQGRVRQAEAVHAANFRALIESLPDLIVVHRQGRIAYVNRAVLVSLGYERAEELLGRPVIDLLAREDIEPFEEHKRRMALDGSVPVREARLLHREGREVPVEASMMSLVFDGEDSVVSIFRDMTERNEMQARLLLADRMASVGMLAAGVAHEINNPLAYITTNLDFAIQKLPRDTQSLEIGDALREAREGARRVQQIVRDLKTFSRGQDDRREPVDVRRVIEASINMAWNEIRHRARLVKDYGPVPMVEATEGRLGQVFLNLLVNAAQAIPAGQADLHEIRVCTRTAPDGRAVIEIRDSGAGIAPEVRGRLFEPFFTTKPPGIGTGLGLTICQRIVTSFGGEITVESEVGRGSTFRVTLPASVERATAAPPPPESQRPVRRGRILVIDDEPLIAAVIRRALAEHEVLAVTDGRAALARMEAGERFDVILCDLMMPNLSGMEVYAELLRIARDQAERVIFVTGGAFSAQAQAFLERVPNIRVDKPFDSQALRTLVNNYLR